MYPPMVPNMKKDEKTPSSPILALFSVFLVRLPIGFPQAKGRNQESPWRLKALTGFLGLHSIGVGTEWSKATWEFPNRLYVLCSHNLAHEHVLSSWLKLFIFERNLLEILFSSGPCGFSCASVSLWSSLLNSRRVWKTTRRTSQAAGGYGKAFRSSESSRSRLISKDKDLFLFWIAGEVEVSQGRALLFEKLHFTLSSEQVELSHGHMIRHCGQKQSLLLLFFFFLVRLSQVKSLVGARREIQRRILKK